MDTEEKILSMTEEQLENYQSTNQEFQQSPGTEQPSSGQASGQEQTPGSEQQPGSEQAPDQETFRLEEIEKLREENYRYKLKYLESIEQGLTEKDLEELKELDTDAYIQAIEKKKDAERIRVEAEQSIQLQELNSFAAKLQKSTQELTKDPAFLKADEFLTAYVKPAGRFGEFTAQQIFTIYKAFSEENAARQTPAGQTSAGQTPAGQTSAGQIPAGQIPAGQTSQARQVFIANQNGGAPLSRLPASSGGNVKKIEDLSPDELEQIKNNAGLEQIEEMLNQF